MTERAVHLPPQTLALCRNAAETLNARNTEMSMKTFIIGTVSACLLLPIIGAGAQADPARTPAIGALQPADLSPGALARFKVEPVSFHAIDETGWTDRPGSDEVYVAIHIPARKIATVTQVFGDVDTGVTKDIPSDQSCILPIAGVTGPKSLSGNAGDRWSCSPDGAPGPFSFTVWLWEHDGCFIFDCYHPAWAPGDEPVRLNIVDDLIGKHTVNKSMEELLAMQVGQSKEENSLVSGGDGIYQFNWRITRLPDAEPVVGPVTRLRESSPRD